MSKGFERWADFCNQHGDRSKQEYGFYGSNEDAPGAHLDYQLCERDAKAGVVRAQMYMAKFRLMWGLE
jgi:hypothetical protein